MNANQLAAYTAGVKASGAQDPDSVDNTIEGGGGDEAAVNNKLRTDWNAYIDWLDKKGLKGHPSLDHDGLGFKMIDEYRKENPNTSVSKDNIIPIQKEFQNYRQYSLNRVKQGHAQLAPGTTEENFMKSLSIIDGFPGQRTSSFKFPDAYLTSFENHKNMGTVNQGFSTTQ